MAAKHNRMTVNQAISELSTRIAKVAGQIPAADPESVARQERRKELAKVWAEDPQDALILLHALACGLYGRKVADAVLRFSVGADCPFSQKDAVAKWGGPGAKGVHPDVQSVAIGDFLRLLLPSLYSRKPPADDALGFEMDLKIRGVDLDDWAKELCADLYAKTERFKDFNLFALNPYKIVNSVYRRIWGTKPIPLLKQEIGVTFESLGWEAPREVNRYLFEGLTAATVGDWLKPCPHGALTLDLILYEAGDDFGIREIVARMGPFNRDWSPPPLAPDDDNDDDDDDDDSGVRLKAGAATTQTIP
jgi:hypothetical protein